MLDNSIHHNDPILIASVGLLGLILGSFINAYIYRTSLKAIKGKKNTLSIFTGRSICPNCKHILAPIDLMPLFSWFFLKGKCRYCSKPISIQYPLVELITSSLFIFSVFYWPFSLSGDGFVLLILWLFILTIIISLAAYDIKFLTLPNRMMYPLIMFVLIFIVYKAIIIKPDNFIINSCIGFLVGGGIFYLIYQISSGKWIGGGDVKLGAILGLLLGSGVNALLLIFIASFLGTLISLPLLLTKKFKRSTLIPFGPFLIIATIILILFSAPFMNWLKVRGISI